MIAGQRLISKENFGPSVHIDMTGICRDRDLPDIKNKSRFNYYSPGIPTPPGLKDCNSDASPGEADRCVMIYGAHCADLDSTAFLKVGLVRKN